MRARHSAVKLTASTLEKKSSPSECRFYKRESQLDTLPTALQNPGNVKDSDKSVSEVIRRTQTSRTTIKLKCGAAVGGG